jgi:hypothetical protein
MAKAVGSCNSTTPGPRGKLATFTFRHAMKIGSAYVEKMLHFT